MEMTHDNLTAAMRYANYMKQWTTAQGTEVAYARNQPGSAVSEFYWHTKDTVSAMTAFAQGATQPDFDTQALKTIEKACEPLGLTVNYLGGFRAGIDDPRNHDWTNNVAALWFTPTGRFYAAHSGRYGIHISPPTDENSVGNFIIQLHAARTEELHGQEEELALANQNRAERGLLLFDSFEHMRWPRSRTAPSATDPLLKLETSRHVFVVRDRVQYESQEGSIRRGSVTEIRHSERPGVSHFVTVKLDNGPEVTLSSAYLYPESK